MNLSVPDSAETYEHHLAAALAAGAKLKPRLPTSRYAAGDLVADPTHGIGVVLFFPRAGKMKVVFERGVRRVSCANQ